ncbi:GNAT family N-acetyltransferase [Paenibacillus sp. sptzw28]|uniref:GNAT family N-acetyltransferase n=1 Tax=Paenibacillus sp. sptzw28 TaxID=715179 RepID=UPI001C6EE0BF|nr:GNAT family N-acetyltransferase [Paenibacillus sp. sptzw28]QYR23223.1 GNAT family N-acetyltransferase [Paenibacillus sp. sptzw28]
MHLNPLRLNEALEICKWKYEGEYSFYDLEESPDAVNELMGGSYFSVKNGISNDLIGFFCFGQSAQVPAAREAGLYGGDGILDIGLGMRPDLTGQGMGMLLLKTGLEFAAVKYKPDIFRLSVAAFNQRAITLYTNIGFKLITSFENNGTEFKLMSK